METSNQSSDKIIDQNNLGKIMGMNAHIFNSKSLNLTDTIPRNMLFIIEHKNRS